MSGGRIAVRVRFKVAGDHRNGQLRGWIVEEGLAGPARFNLAVLGTSVPVGHIAVVAILDAAPKDSVAAGALAGTHGTGVRAALGLALAGRGTAIVGQGVAIVAGLAGFLLPVSTDGCLAGARAAGAIEARFDLARRRTAVAVRRVAIVTGFEPLQDAITTSRGARLARHAADEAGLDGLAIARAAVATCGIAVVAGLVRGQDTASAISYVLAGFSFRWAVPVRLDLAKPAATVAIGCIAVVALLATLDDPVSTGPASRPVHVRIGDRNTLRVELDDDAASSTAATW